MGGATFWSTITFTPPPPRKVERKIYVASWIAQPGLRKYNYVVGTKKNNSEL